MKFKGRIVSVTISLLLSNFYALYFLFRDGYIDPIIWIGYPITLSVSYWTGLQYDNAKYLAEKDTLTGLYNRRFVMNFYEKLLSMSKRNNEKLFVMVIDCDNFKTINDHFGHKTGDEVLKQIAHILESKTRSSDIATRWGGDEFMVIGKFKGHDGMCHLTTRIENEIQKLSHKMKLPISASIGTAIASDKQFNLEELLVLADESMYKKKKMNQEAGQREIQPNRDMSKQEVAVSC